MPLRFLCPACGQRLSTAASKAGQRVKCPTCRRVVCVPDAQPGLEQGTATPLPGSGGVREPESPPPQILYEPAGTGLAPGLRPAGDGNGDQRPDGVTVPRRVIFMQGFLLGAVALGFFVLGVIVGSRSVRQAALAGPSGPVAYSGTVTYRDATEVLRPDGGAVVCLVPATHHPEQQFVADDLGPETSREAGRVRPDPAFRTALNSLGGDWAYADAEGRFRLRVPGAGRYYLLMISGHSRRDSEPGLKSRDLAEIGRYFLPVATLLGEHRYAWQEVLLRQDEQRDFTF